LRVVLDAFPTKYGAATEDQINLGRMLMKAYPDQSDLGRAKVTKADADKMSFKVPSMRDIEKTGPYFHNGKVGAIKEAVAQMADYQTGKRLSAADAKSIVRLSEDAHG
jgi:cytochrome c peroxidase